MTKTNFVFLDVLTRIAELKIDQLFNGMGINYKINCFLKRESLKFMKTAVIQLNATKDKSKNIEKAIDLVRQAITQRAEFILLPEVFNFRGKLVSGVSENIPGETIRPLMVLAKENNVFILAGSIYEKIKEDTKFYNTSVLINNQGNIAAKYRKNHLFDAVLGGKKILESKQFSPGRRIVFADIKGFRAGLSICYDLRFSEMYRKYALGGAHLMCVPAAFIQETGRDHWEVLLRARAIENVCYVLAPNQMGKDNRGIVSYGHSMIIDPWGKILARASGTKEGVIYANLDKKFLKEKRMVLGRARNNEKK